MTDIKIALPLTHSQPVRWDAVKVENGKVIPLMGGHDRDFLESFYQLNPRDYTVILTPAGYYRHGESFRGMEPII